MRYRLDLSYDGSEYAGWQIQPNGMSIQQTVEEALAAVVQEKSKLHASGRTDQGVHARLQVAHFDLNQDLRINVIPRALNAVLPDDIRVLAFRKVPNTFHARRSVRLKEYRYFIHNSTVLPPFHRRYRTLIRKPLDIRAMQAAADCLVGTHDFAAFSANADRIVESTVRTLSILRVRKRGPEVVIIAAADGFLYRMVRSLSGFLLRVGEGALAPSCAKEVLESCVRTAVVPTAPPQGLFLWNVHY